MKPKQNKVGETNKSHTYDQCQTPHYALDPLIPYLPYGVIWESAVGNGQIADKLQIEGFEVVSTDILNGYDFFKYTPLCLWDCQVTNPPYSVKYQWLERSYQLGKPFALLLPLETLGAAAGQRLFAHYGTEIVLPDKRINFNMPNKGYSGNGAQFPTAWFTWRLDIGQQLTFVKISRYADEQPNFWSLPGVKQEKEGGTQMVMELDK